LLFFAVVQTKQFSDPQETITFYQERYTRGYMNYWSSFERDRLKELLREMNLPPSGIALDFGCGQGIFTEVIRTCLPRWKIFGCDISKQAIEFAKQNFTEVEFFVIGDSNYEFLKADFIHTHHVLEHAFDAQQAADTITKFSAEHAQMLHILPCNHAGSLEQKVSVRLKDGYDRRNGKFFFEDVGHLRRLNLQEALQLFAPHGFTLKKAFYANQYAGAIRWISHSWLGLVLRFTSMSGAKSSGDTLKQFFLRIFLLFTWFCTFSATAFALRGYGNKHFLRKLIQVLLFIPFFWFTVPVHWYIIKRAIHEWKNKRNDKNGSEMFLIMQR
jgi:SAM-dependent methyltransferase